MSYFDQTGCLRQSLPYPVDSDCSELYARLRHLTLPVWLTSGNNPGCYGRYDVITAAPEKVLRTQGRETSVITNDGSRYCSDENPFLVLKAEFEKSAQGLPREKLPNMFPGGALGYFSYELLHSWYGITPGAADDIALPSMLVGIYQWAIITDHEQQSCELIALPTCPESLVEDVLNCLSVPAAEHSDEAFKLLEPFQSNFTEQEYLQAFQRVIDYIHAGDCYQVNLAQRFTASYQGDTLQAFRHLHKLANAPFSAYMEDKQGDSENILLSFSPERFIRVDDCDVMTQPIKGTRPRDQDPQRDQELLHELQNSRKDQAENLMIVDLLRNDLGQVCETGSVKVPSLFATQSFNNVHHLVSTITGRLRQPEAVFELMAASFPGGSITGAPKIRAMEIINELETRGRSVYCGSVAYFGFNGNMDSNICIRTLVANGKQIHCWGGGGVVADSVGSQEYQETFDKISIFINNL